MVTVTLYRDDIVKDIMTKSHDAVASLGNAEERYNLEAGLHKKKEITRNVIEALGEIEGLLGRYLVAGPDLDDKDANNQAELPESFVMELNLAERRSLNKAKPLALAIHNYIVAAALVKFYATVGHEIGNNFQTVETAALKTISRLIHTKSSPRL